MSLLVLAFATSGQLVLPGPAAAGAAKAAGPSSRSWSSGSPSRAVTSGSSSRSARGYHYTSGSGEDADVPGGVDAWAYSRDGGDRRNTHGSRADWRDAEAAIDRTDGHAFWFRRGNDRYLVTDPAALRELAELFAPQEDLGRRQGELGRRQGELGRLQGDLGRKQGQLGRIQARLAQQRASMALARASRDRRDLADLEREAEEIDRRQDEASQLQSELGEHQSKLGERQAELGERQAELGREQERVSKQVRAELERLTREWIADRRAERLAR
jgi:hypothetical protein